MHTPSDPVPVLDVFAGAGGLSEGFAAFPDRNAPAFRIALSIEKDPRAIQTLRLRAFFRAFAPVAVPNDYYRFLQGDPPSMSMQAYLNGALPLEALLDEYDGVLPVQPGDVWHLELGDSQELERLMDARITQAIGGHDDWVLVGGPPCQPFSTVGRSKQKSLKGYELGKDHRHKLYLEYLRIIARHWPAVFVMENVRGILSAKISGEKIFEKILDDLGDPAYGFNQSVTASGRRHTYHIWPLEDSTARTPDLFGRHSSPDGYVIESERHGIPQMRHRVILLGIRDDVDIHPIALKSRAGHQATVSSVINGLPRLRSGIARTPDSRDQWRHLATSTNITTGSRLLSREDIRDVTDSDEQWLHVLRSAADHPWFLELKEAGQDDIIEVLRTTLTLLLPPRDGRGRDCLDGRAEWPDDNEEPELRDWIHDPRMGFVCHHSTREHMPADIHRYLFAAAFATARGISPRLRDFPKNLLPKHKNVQNALSSHTFADRFRVQVTGLPASTVLSHIAKDGHYFIHPDPSQARSLSVREVARLQTFPDNYWFFGNRSEQYTQIGNAVPPLLSFRIAEVVADVMIRRKLAAAGAKGLANPLGPALLKSQAVKPPAGKETESP